MVLHYHKKSTQQKKPLFLVPVRILWPPEFFSTAYFNFEGKRNFLISRNFMLRLHSEILLFSTFSLLLEDIDTFQCSSDSFPHWPHISGCAKLSELHFDVSFFSHHGEKVLKRHITMGQIWDRFSWPFPPNWRTMIHWNVLLRVLHTHWDIWSMWKTVGTTLKCINVLQSRGEGPK